MKRCFVNTKGYSIIELLGQGSYGRVYKAWSPPASSTGSREVVAVKCIERQLVASTKSAEDCMINEIGILKMLKHPNIVELKDFSWDEKYIYLILEYCTFSDLSKMLAKYHRLSEKVTERFLWQVANALHFLRNYNISHFDLKPQNILLTYKSEVTLKLADFGFARIMSSKEFMAGYRGTPLYMAPEMLLRHVCIPKADLWSVGIILYECLFGVTPFAADSPSAMASQLRNVRCVRLPSDFISNECADLLSKLLRADPAERIDFEEFFCHPFVSMQSPLNDSTLKRGIAKMECAIKAEHTHQWQRAVDLYCEGLEDILPFLSHADIENKRAELRSCALRCLQRAEKLKALVSKSDDAGCEDARMEKLWADSPQVQACLLLALSAKSLAAEGKLSKAVQKYNLIIPSAQELLASSSMSDGFSNERNNLLRERIQQWVTRRDAIRCKLLAVNRTGSANVEASKVASSSSVHHHNQERECSIS